jgi:signal peptidase I
MAPDTTFSYAHTALRKAAEAERALETPSEPAADGLVVDTSDVFDEQARIWIAEDDTADRVPEADREVADRLEDAEARATELLSSARIRADALVAEADALARQRRAEAERWSRTHVAEADQAGTQRILDAELQAREILEQARRDATRVRAEPQPEERREPVPAPAASASAETSDHGRWSGRLKAAAVVVLLVAGLLGSMAIRHFVAQPFIVESQSMEPELHQGDRLLVDKVAYRLADAKRGDIVVIDTAGIAGGSSAELGRTIVKRVIGLPGETVSAQNGRLFIDGSPIDEPWLGDVPTTAFGPVQVLEGELFVLGDERALSIDSRTFGPIVASAVLGRVEAIIWPPDHVGRV